jgi:hypothetical protein
MSHPTKLPPNPKTRNEETEFPDVTVFGVLRHLATHPGELLLKRWNWKASLLSGLIRATIYFATNLTHGWAAAAGAMSAEFVFRILTTGFYASLIQSFRKVKPAWMASLTVLLLMPIVALGVEFLYHTAIGTPNFRTSFKFSIGFTALSALFNLYANRRGAIVVGPDGQSLGKDLRSMPRIVLDFILIVPRAVARGARGIAS